MALEATAGSVSLTPRQREVILLVAQGYTHREIAERLGISPRTVLTHFTAINFKLGTKSIREAARQAAKGAP